MPEHNVESTSVAGEDPDTLRPEYLRDFRITLNNALNSPALPQQARDKFKPDPESLIILENPKAKRNFKGHLNALLKEKTELSLAEYKAFIGDLPDRTPHEIKDMARTHFMGAVDRQYVAEHPEGNPKGWTMRTLIDAHVNHILSDLNIPHESATAAREARIDQIGQKLLLRNYQYAKRKDRHRVPSNELDAGIIAELNKAFEDAVAAYIIAGALRTGEQNIRNFGTTLESGMTIQITMPIANAAGEAGQTLNADNWRESLPKADQLKIKETTRKVLGMMSEYYGLPMPPERGYSAA